MTPSCCSFLGCSLRPLDLEFMKHLSKVVNIIPVIAKADTMTLEEKIEFKQRVSISAPAWGPSLPRLGDGRHELYPSCWTAAQPPGTQSHRVGTGLACKPCHCPEDTAAHGSEDTYSGGYPRDSPS